jgi:hypothetical protein
VSELGTLTSGVGKNRGVGENFVREDRMGGRVLEPAAIAGDLCGDCGAGCTSCPLGGQSAGDAVDSTDHRNHQRRADGVLEVAGALQDHRDIDQAGGARAVRVR